MELKIKQKKEKRKRTPHYVVEVEFMFGDADGYQKQTLEFDTDPKSVKTMETFILAAVCCCAAYPHGRGGYDSYSGLPEYDAFFNESGDEYEDENDQKRFDELRAISEEAGIFMEHPYDPGGDGIESSFDSVSVYFVDENGDKSEVETKLTKEEQEHIMYARDFFNKKRNRR